METEKRSFHSGFSFSESRKSKLKAVRGYAAVFNSWSQNLGWFKEMIDPGAFDKCNMTDVVCCLNHDFNILFARTPETLQLGIDKRGLWYEFTPPNTSQGNDLAEHIRTGNISKSSFQFIVEKDRWIDDPEQGKMRIIQKIPRLIDVSPVTFAAYQETNVAERSYKTKKAGNKIEKTFFPSQLLDAEIEILNIKYKK